MKIPVYKIDLDDYVLEEYDSLSQAARENKTYPSTIHRAIKREGSTGGFKWDYVMEEEEDDMSQGTTTPQS